jgi:hypothetical protein
MKRNPNRRRAPYKAEALVPAAPRRQVSGGYGKHSPFPTDASSDPALRETPGQVRGSGASINWGAPPTMAADEVKKQKARHEKNANPSKRAKAEARMLHR